MRSRRETPVVGDPSEKYLLVSDLACVPEGGLCHERRHGVRRTEPRAMDRMKGAGEEAMECLVSRR